MARFFNDELNIKRYNSPTILCNKDNDKCTINIQYDTNRSYCVRLVPFNSPIGSLHHSRESDCSPGCIPALCFGILKDLDSRQIFILDLNPSEMSIVIYSRCFLFDSK